MQGMRDPLRRNRYPRIRPKKKSGIALAPKFRCPKAKNDAEAKIGHEGGGELETFQTSNSQRSPPASRDSSEGFAEA